jgi:hypothetical protein
MAAFDTIRALLKYEEESIRDLKLRQAYSNTWARSEFNKIANIDPKSGETGVALAIAIALSAIADLDRDE